MAQFFTGTWARNQLFLVTPSAVVLVFAAAGSGSGRIVGLGGTADPFVEVQSPCQDHNTPDYTAQQTPLVLRYLIANASLS